MGSRELYSRRQRQNHSGRLVSNPEARERKLENCDGGLCSCRGERWFSCCLTRQQITPRHMRREKRADSIASSLFISADLQFAAKTECDIPSRSYWSAPRRLG